MIKSASIRKMKTQRFANICADNMEIARSMEYSSNTVATKLEILDDDKMSIKSNAALIKLKTNPDKINDRKLFLFLQPKSQFPKTTFKNYPNQLDSTTPSKISSRIRLKQIRYRVKHAHTSTTCGLSTITFNSLRRSN